MKHCIVIVHLLVVFSTGVKLQINSMEPPLSAFNEPSISPERRFILNPFISQSPYHTPVSAMNNPNIGLDRNIVKNPFTSQSWPPPNPVISEEMIIVKPSTSAMNEPNIPPDQRMIYNPFISYIKPPTDPATSEQIHSIKPPMLMSAPTYQGYSWPSYFGHSAANPTYFGAPFPDPTHLLDWAGFPSPYGYPAAHPHYHGSLLNDAAYLGNGNSAYSVESDFGPSATTDPLLKPLPSLDREAVRNKSAGEDAAQVARTADRTSKKSLTAADRPKKKSLTAADRNRSKLDVRTTAEVLASLILPLSTKECPVHTAAAVNDLCFSLSETLESDIKNVLFSPLAIAELLVFVHIGAGGNTSQRIEHVAYFEMNQLVEPNATEALYIAFAMVNNALTNGGYAWNKSPEYQLHFANTVFLQKDFQLLNSYAQKLNSTFAGSVVKVDFSRKGDSTMREINRLVAEKTNNMVKRIVEAPLSMMTRMALTSAVYFKGSWKKAFPKNNTRPQSFYRFLGAQRQSVAMMRHINENFLYLNDLETGYQFLALPYKGDDLALLIALPKQRYVSADLPMTPATFCRVKGALKATRMEEVAIPRFRIEEAMPHLLAQLGGLDDMFPWLSDNMNDMAFGHRYSVGPLLHKVVMEVSEEGTVASGGDDCRGPKSDDGLPLPSFVADHPFLMYVYHKKLGIILLSGRVNDPTTA